MELRPQSLVVVDTTWYIPFALTCFCDTFAHPIVTLHYPWSNFQSKVLPSGLTSAHKLTGCSEEQYLPALHVLSTPIDNMLNYPAQKQTDRHADKTQYLTTKLSETINHTTYHSVCICNQQQGLRWMKCNGCRPRRACRQRTNELEIHRPQI